MFAEATLSIIVLLLGTGLLWERKRNEKREAELLNLCLRATGMPPISVDTSGDEAPPPVLGEVPREFQPRVRFQFPDHLKPSAPHVAPLGQAAAKGK